MDRALRDEALVRRSTLGATTIRAREKSSSRSRSRERALSARPFRSIDGANDHGE